MYVLLAAGTLCCCAFTGCRQDIGWVHDLENGDFSRVRCQRCPPGLQPAVPSGKARQLMGRMREYFIERQALISTVAAQCPGAEPSPLDEFKLQGVWADTLDGRLMVQFFAHYRQPRLFAGRRVQFLVDKGRQLEAIYVSDAPLEQ